MSVVTRPAGPLRAIARLALCSAAALTTAGCVSYRPVPPLGDAERAEFARLAPIFAAERIRVVAADDRAKEDAGEIEAAVRLAAAVFDAPGPSLTIEVHESWQSFEEPWLGVFTLGLFPERGRGWRQTHWRLVAEDGRQVAGDAEMESPFWFGWLVAPIALLPGWRLTTFWDDDEQRREEHSDARRERIALGIARSVVRLRDAAPPPPASTK